VKIVVDSAKLITAAVAAFLALILPFEFISTQSAIEWIKHYGYLSMSALLLVTLGALWPSLKQLNRHSIGFAALKRHRPGILLILTGSIFLHIHEESSFKILFDEHTLSSTAKNLHEKQTAFVQTAGHIITEELQPRIGIVDKRPLLFPYLLSLTHHILGYDVENVFLLNSALSLLLLCLSYYLVARFCGASHACLSILLLLGLPLLAQNTNGGGYELLNLCLITALILSGIYYLKHRSPAGGLNLHVMTAVLLANVRYESILFVLVPAALFLVKSIRLRQLRLTWLSALSPLLLILPLLNYAVFQGIPQFIQTDQENFFDLSHLPGNLVHACTYLFAFGTKYSNSALLTICGLFAIIMTGCHILRRPREHLFINNTLTVLAIVFIIVAANTLLALSCYWGEWTDPLTSRFSLPLQLLMALLLSFILKTRYTREGPPAWLLALAGLHLVFIAPAHIARMANEPRLPNAVGYDWAVNWIREHQKNEHSLFLAKSAIGIGLLEKAAIPFMIANAMPERVLLTRKLGLYDEIYALERFVEQPDGKYVVPAADQGLNPRYQLKTVAEKQVRPGLIYRISQVTGLSKANGNNRTLAADLPQYETGEEISLHDVLTHHRDILPLVPASFKSSRSEGE